MFLLAYPVEATRCGTAVLFIKNIAEKENINAKMTSKLNPVESNRIHTERIFRAFSIGTSITVAFASHTKECVYKAM